MKQLLFFAVLFFCHFVSGQDTLSRNAYSIKLNAGLPFEKYHKWYNPRFSTGFDFEYAVRLKRRFYISAGVGLNYSEVRTDPYFRSVTHTTYYQWAGTSYSSTTTDSYLREKQFSFFDLHVPIRFQYMPMGKWKPYFSVGVGLNFSLITNEQDFLAGTNSRAEMNSYNDYYGVPNAYFAVGPELAGGIKYQAKQLEFLFGLEGRMKGYAFSDDYPDRITLGLEIGIRKSIPSSKFPHGLNKVRVDESRATSKNYLYVEALGATLIGSFNYERAVFTQNRHRVRARVGVGFPWHNDFQLPVTVGANWSYGVIHAFELGLNFTPLLGNSSDFLIAPSASYRLETRKNLFTRFSVVPLYIDATDQILVIFGASIGIRF